MSKAKTKTIQLSEPIPVPKEGGGEVKVSEITIGMLRAKHLKVMPAEMFDEATRNKVRPQDIIPIIAALTDLPETSIDEIAFDDLVKIGKEMGDFLADLLPETGKK